MRTLRLLAGLVVGTALVVPMLGLPQADAADPTYPSGTFHLDRSSGYLHEDKYGDRDSYVDFTLTRDSLTDDVTDAADIVVRLVDGSGNGHTLLWPNTAAPLHFSYGRLGTYSPQLWLTDADHHTTVVDLPDITVLKDFTAPYVRLDLPAAGQRNRVAAWRTLHGPATDAGVGSVYVSYQAMQKRGAYWYFFNEPRFIDKDYPARWVKGRRTLAATRAARYNYNTVGTYPGSGRWLSHPLVKLTRGPLVICYEGRDYNDNATLSRCVTTRLTRR